MECRLIPHPFTPASAVSEVIAEIARTEEGMVVIRFSASGEVRKLRIPESVRYASRQDGLWQTTCFEAFVAPSGGTAYAELNFAPSTGWAAYRFPSYRDGREDLPLPTPHFDVELLPDRLEVTVAVDVSEMAELTATDQWRANIAAVIEEADGTKSYWALAHPAGDPDFHHPDCFVLDLPPPASS